MTILLERGRLGQTTSQVELGTSPGIDKSNVARLCARMEAAGHVVQRRAEATWSAAAGQSAPSGGMHHP